MKLDNIVMIESNTRWIYSNTICLKVILMHVSHTPIKQLFHGMHLISGGFLGGEGDV